MVNTLKPFGPVRSVPDLTQHRANNPGQSMSGGYSRIKRHKVHLTANLLVAHLSLSYSFIYRLFGTKKFVPWDSYSASRKVS